MKVGSQRAVAVTGSPAQSARALSVAVEGAEAGRVAVVRLAVVTAAGAMEAEVTAADRAWRGR